jgi:hypothetical protein
VFYHAVQEVEGITITAGVIFEEALNVGPDLIGNTGLLDCVTAKPIAVALVILEPDQIVILRS